MRTGTAVPIERGGRPNYNDHTISISHRIQEIETTGTKPPFQSRMEDAKPLT